MQFLGKVAIVLAIASVAASCAEAPSSPDASAVSPELTRSSIRGGTTLAISTTASGFSEERTEYDWSLKKSVASIMGDDMAPTPSTTSTEIVPGKIRWIEYQVTAQRYPKGSTSSAGARGSVCVTNGAAATTDLAIAEVVSLASDPGPILAQAPVSIADKPVLSANESHCYPFELAFSTRQGTQYTAVARVSVTNYASHQGSSYVSSGVAPFAVPNAVTRTTKNASAVVTDLSNQPCMNIFPSIICTGAEGLHPITFTESGTAVLPTVDGHNYKVCGETLPFTSKAQLVASGPYAPGESPLTRVDSAVVLITTGDCTQPPSGCTYTLGYWKNHPWPAHPMWPTVTLATWPDINNWKFFDSGMEWPDVLAANPKGGDEYLILAHQYIAAILNQQNGAYVPPQVRTVLESAYEYFSSSPTVRAAFSRDAVLGWASLLDAYNNGQLGVPHCG